MTNSTDQPPQMEGILIVDKPQGLTSHDVVAAARRVLRTPRIGHTGTLDPLATGVLPLAIGRATRLVRFLSATNKTYEATIRFGITTDTYDITGAETGRTDAAPPREAVLRALDELRGDYLQTPPAYSAKKIGGRRAYDLARRDEAVVLEPVPVTVTQASLAELGGQRARIVLTCSAGFYVRSFAHTLGVLTGAGACLEALRRTRSGDFGVDRAVTLDALQTPGRAVAALIPLDGLLGGLPAVRVTARGREAVSHGREVGPGEYAAVGTLQSPALEWVRLLDDEGALIAVGTWGRAPAALHPSVVLI